MKHRWIAVVFLAVSLGFIIYFWTTIPSEMAPLEDRSMVSVSSTAQEGATFDYMRRYTDDLLSEIENSVPETNGILQMVGMGGRNRANFQVSLVSPDQRERSQQEIADDLTPKVARFTGARSFVNQQQTFGGRRGGMPVQYVIQAKDLDSLKVIIPIFLNEVAKSDVFGNSDVNLRDRKSVV